jgi:hypothetical protein
VTALYEEMKAFEFERSKVLDRSIAPGPESRAAVNCGEPKSALR